MPIFRRTKALLLHLVCCSGSNCCILLVFSLHILVYSVITEVAALVWGLVLC